MAGTSILCVFVILSATEMTKIGQNNPFTFTV